MSTSKPKVTSKPPVTTPAPPGDHRKRKRNRTTQSCLNCHASKRMCDRRRPACQRCTTLGLTGLCVYEVDDPSQRCVASDEKALLRNRVAELEGVVREMKNKPHPRWAQTLSSSGATEYQQGQDERPRTSFLSVPHIEIETCPSLHSDPGCSSSSSGPASPPEIELSPVPSLAGSGFQECRPITPYSVPPFSSEPEVHSSTQSVSASPLLANLPPSGQRLPNAVDSMAAGLNIESLFTPGAFESTGFETGIYGHMLDHIMASDAAKSPVDYAFPQARPSVNDCCSCINNSSVYSTLLELSVRLRKTVECFDAAAEHRSEDAEMGCQLYKLVRDLDRITSNSLADAMSPTERQVMNGSFFSALSGGVSASAGGSQSTEVPAPWPRSSPSRSAVDGFMSWEAIPREAWP